jgi:hypothetical protein
MIDEVLCARSKDNFVSNHDPAESIIEKHLTNPTAPNLNVVFPAWHGGGNLTTRLVSRLSREDAVLEYHFHDQVLEPDIERVKQ